MPALDLMSGSRLGDLAADRDAVDAQLVAAAEVGLHQHADGVAAVVGRQPARRGADAALEAVADHPGAAADVAFGHRSTAGIVERLEHVRLLHVTAADVVQRAVPGLGHDRQEAPVALGVPLGHVGDGGVVHGADAAGVGDEDRVRQRLEVADPVRPGHLAVAVQRVGGGEDGGVPDVLARQHRGDAGAHRTSADLERALAAHDRGVADQHAVDVGDGVVGPGGQRADGDAELTRPLACRRLCRQARVDGDDSGQHGQQQQRRAHPRILPRAQPARTMDG